MRYLERIRKLHHQIANLIIEVKQLKQQKHKVIALIKDGRFVEALQELEKER